MNLSGRMDIPCRRTMFRSVYTYMRIGEKRHFGSAKVRKEKYDNP